MSFAFRIEHLALSDFLSTPLQFLKGVGPRKAADLKRAGLVTVATPASSLAIVASYTPEFMTEALDEGKDGQITAKAIECVLGQRTDVIAARCTLGLHDEIADAHWRQQPAEPARLAPLGHVERVGEQLGGSV